MNTTPNVAALLGIVRRYHPAGVDTEDVRYDASVEARRLSRIIGAQVRAISPDREVGLPDVDEELPDAAATTMREWRRFLEALQGTLPDDDVVDTTIPGHDPCYRCRLYTGGVSIHGGGAEVLLSLLAPVYTVVGEGADRTLARACRLVEEMFGFTHVSPALLATPVEDIVPRAGNRALGEAVLGDLLFSPHIDHGWTENGMEVPPVC